MASRDHETIRASFTAVTTYEMQSRMMINLVESRRVLVGRDISICGSLGQDYSLSPGIRASSHIYSIAAGGESPHKHTTLFPTSTSARWWEEILSPFIRLLSEYMFAVDLSPTSSSSFGCWRPAKTSLQFGSNKCSHAHQIKRQQRTTSTTPHSGLSRCLTRNPKYLQHIQN